MGFGASYKNQQNENPSPIITQLLGMLPIL